MRGHGRPYLGPFSTWAARATATQGAAHGAGRLQSWDGAGGGRRDGVAGRVLSERMTSVRSAQARNGMLCRKSGSVSCGRPRELLDPGRQTELNLSKQPSDPVHPLPVTRAHPSGRRLCSGRGTDSKHPSGGRGAGGNGQQSASAVSSLGRASCSSDANTDLTAGGARLT